MKRAILAAIACLVLLISLAYADRSRETYSEVRAAPGVYRGGNLSSADSLNGATPLDTSGDDKSIIRLNGNPNLAVSPTFSVAGANAVVAFHRYVEVGGTYHRLGISVATITASSTHLDGSRYVPTSTQLFDSHGAPYGELRIVSISSGNVDLSDHVTFGADSE